MAHVGGDDSVAGGGSTAALHVAQNGHAGIQCQFFLDALGNAVRAAVHALGHDDHEVGTAGQSGPADGFHHAGFKVQMLFRHDHHGGADSQTNGHGQVACVTAHNFYHGAALVRLHGIPETVNALQSGVAGGVVADGIAGAGNVVVDGAGDAHHGNASLGQCQQAVEGTVTADAHQGVQTQQLAGGHGLLLAFLGHKFLAAGRVQHGTAAAGNVTNAFKIQLHKVAVDQAVVAAANADDFNAQVQGHTNNGADGSVHAGGIAAAGQYADAAYSRFHISIPPNIGNNISNILTTVL